MTDHLKAMADPHGTKQQQNAFLALRGWEFDNDAMCWCRYSNLDGSPECFNSTREACDYQIRIELNTYRSTP